MKPYSKLFIIALTLVAPLQSQQLGDRTLHPADIDKVRVTGGFWASRIEINRTVTIPHVIQECYETGRVDNLKVAAGLKDGEYCTVYQFDDSDVYKSIEAASYALMVHPDKGLEGRVDSLIAIIAKAQEPDGYLYSPRKAPSKRIKNAIGPERWSNLRWSHELYVLGHLYEAAAAHARATGKRTLLDVALKSAALILQTFNPQHVQLPPGHQEVELGLMKLYELLHERRYADQAQYFLDIRGRGKELTGRESWEAYAQDHAPVLEQREAVGHAVRAAYMYTAMTQVGAVSGNERYGQAADALWQNVVGRKLYITGGIGATGNGEAFGPEYDLPNASAYNETCSSIANMMWNGAMFSAHADGKYLDVFERTLYNAFLSGVGMDGKSFFYPNPLQSYGTQARAAWFTCACCPPNVARFIASLPSRIYSTSGSDVYVNLFVESEAQVPVGDDTVTLRQETRYPWDGAVRIAVQPSKNDRSFTLRVRIPGWTMGEPMDGDLYRFTNSAGVPHVLVNGTEVALNIEKGFAVIQRNWRSGDRVDVSLPMDIRRIVANDKVDADRGRVALQRGPIVFCVEWCDTKDGVVRNLVLPDNANLTTAFEPGLLNGVVTIKGTGQSISVVDSSLTEKRPEEFSAIPYYSWAHRGLGEMSVWLAREEKAASPLHGPTLASLSTVTVSSGKNPKAINDQMEPKSSADESVPFFHWWPHKGTTEWVQFDFPHSAEVSEVKVYWFDDTGAGECRVPQSWKILYNVEGKWNPVYSTDKYGATKDGYNAVAFETVRTSAIRIEIQSIKDFAGGIHEITLR